jgi:hypothetical protein
MKPLNTIKAIAIGTIAGIVIFIPLIWLYYGIADEKRSAGAVILFILVFSLPLLIAGWITAILSPKNYLLTTALTGLCLIVCVLINNDFKHIDTELLVILSVAIPITMAGGVAGIAIGKKGKSISKKLPSSPGNPLQ